MRVEEFVGQRVRDRRNELHMTQHDFGQKLAPYLGKPWSRSTVSVAENGGRAFTAAELIAISHVLSTTAGRLLTPPAGVASVDLPGGEQIPASALAAALVPLTDQGKPFDATQDTLVALLDDLRAISTGTTQAGEHLRRLNEELWQAAEMVSGTAERAEVQPDGR